uniref:Uncharacterized protein n=1 Tax=Rhizophora mucronata TaxID=61149 RepID=A0A2P2PAG8_RHIMU
MCIAVINDPLCVAHLTDELPRLDHKPNKFSTP